LKGNLYLERDRVVPIFEPLEVLTKLKTRPVTRSEEKRRIKRGPRDYLNGIPIRENGVGTNTLK